ncbi:unnamed protein product [Clavelina lepadiformis]|uniref:Uncharacterized protein n=1 Tax=Clavelina lepadiformis TaxID=159417 RepID=A0ABP0GWW0_CLALP
MARFETNALDVIDLTLRWAYLVSEACDVTCVRVWEGFEKFKGLCPPDSSSFFPIKIRRSANF